MPFEVIPAIDLRDGRCVRLVQGDYDRETVYSDDPVEVARRWQTLGARRLHVVDLDGARRAGRGARGGRGGGGGGGGGPRRRAPPPPPPCRRGRCLRRQLHERRPR